MEQNKEMTPQRSLSLIAETLNNSRRDILRGSAKHFILWGIVLTIFSLIIYFCWHFTGNPFWNFLWFALPLVGFPLSAVLSKKEQRVPQNELGRLLGEIWIAYAVFAICLSLTALLAVPMNVTLIIVILFGFAECISGIVLKNWPIIVAGFILGVAGAIMAMLIKSEAQLLLFTLGGVLLVLSGVAVRLQYK